MTFQAERSGEFATFQAQVSVTRRGTKVVVVEKIAQQDSAMVMGHQTGGKSETETCNFEAPAKKKIKKQRISRRGAIITGKRKELSPQDAAIMIQSNFRAYMFRRSHSLRALRELANAKAKLKELRKQFNDFTYRRLGALDVEDRQRLRERIIGLLLAVNDVEGVDLMVKSARKSMLDKLKSMINDMDRGL